MVPMMPMGSPENPSVMEPLMDSIVVGTALTTTLRIPLGFVVVEAVEHLLGIYPPLDQQDPMSVVEGVLGVVGAHMSVEHHVDQVAEAGADMALPETPEYPIMAMEQEPMVGQTRVALAVPLCIPVSTTLVALVVEEEHMAQQISPPSSSDQEEELVVPDGATGDPREELVVESS